MITKTAGGEKPLLAFQAHDGGEAGAIVFARSGAEARRRAADEMGVDWAGVEWCRRARSLDQYAPGPVPPEALIENGWWFKCHGCEKHVDDETPSPVFDGEAVFCSPWCRLNHLADQIVTRKEESRVKDMLADEVRERWPGVTVARTQVNVLVQPGGAVRVNRAVVWCDFPGGTYPMRYAACDLWPGCAGLSVSAADLEAWASFTSGIPQAEQGSNR